LKQYHELIESYGDVYVPLREYPMRKVLAIYAYGSTAEPELVEPGCYSLCPEIEERLDIPHTLRLAPTVEWRLPGVSAFKAVYRVGYSPGEAGDPYRVPADLASACLELAVWNMSRYRRKRIGMTGNIRGSGKDGEHLEASRKPLTRHQKGERAGGFGTIEPYKRRTI
jgi:hypothetical protein